MSRVDSWSVLGIAPTEDQKAIKRAYAAALKEFPPDRDPAGFRRVREAYDDARQQAAWGIVVSDEIDADFDDDDFDDEDNDAASGTDGTDLASRREEAASDIVNRFCALYDGSSPPDSEPLLAVLNEPRLNNPKIAELVEDKLLVHLVVRSAKDDPSDPDYWPGLPVPVRDRLNELFGWSGEVEAYSVCWSDEAGDPAVVRFVDFVETQDAEPASEPLKEDASAAPDAEDEDDIRFETTPANELMARFEALFEKPASAEREAAMLALLDDPALDNLQTRQEFDDQLLRFLGWRGTPEDREWIYWRTILTPVWQRLDTLFGWQSRELDIVELFGDERAEPLLQRLKGHSVSAVEHAFHGVKELDPARKQRRTKRRIDAVMWWIISAIVYVLTVAFIMQLFR